MTNAKKCHMRQASLEIEIKHMDGYSPWVRVISLVIVLSNQLSFHILWLEITKIFWFFFQLSKEKTDTYRDILVVEVKSISTCKLVLRCPYFSNDKYTLKIHWKLSLYYWPSKIKTLTFGCLFNHFGKKVLRKVVY